ncbi:HlyD family secretion protein [Stenotrophomonas pigmentata]|uniref:HlyD family secretion protein n=1 Tax=Stenotrophomonas pigmentata TaxID=3055080 RepID=UPI0026EAD22D|nr:HlyD family efflux transporter periplasmic adaptor subunit [Stenotrophomonas sp. 610A2]
MSQTETNEELRVAVRRWWWMEYKRPAKLYAYFVGTFSLIVVSLIALAVRNDSEATFVAGRLVPVQGMATVLAPVTGVVRWLDADDGKRVVAGEALALVAVQRTLPELGDASLALELGLRQKEDSIELARDAFKEQLAVQAAGLNEQMHAARAEARLIELEIAARREQIRMAGDVLARRRSSDAATTAGLVAAEQQEALLLDYSVQLQSLRRQQAATQRLIAQLKQAALELPGRRKANDATYAGHLAQLRLQQVENEANAALLVKAPVDGVVVAQMVKPGQSVHLGQPLLSVLPGDGRLQAELMVPGRAIGAMAPGDRVVLRYQAFPHQKFGMQRGTIARISRTAVDSEEASFGPGVPAVKEAFYRVTVELANQAIVAHGRLEPLKPGMLLDAQLSGEREPLSDRLLQPMYSFGGWLGGR